MNRDELYIQEDFAPILTYADEQGVGRPVFQRADEIHIVTFQARKPFEVDGIQYQHPNFILGSGEPCYVGWLFEFKECF